MYAKIIHSSLQPTETREKEPFLTVLHRRRFGSFDIICTSLFVLVVDVAKIPLA
jgi:hypothetical protein